MWALPSLAGGNYHEPLVTVFTTYPLYVSQNVQDTTEATHSNCVLVILYEYTFKFDRPHLRNSSVANQLSAGQLLVGHHCTLHNNIY